MIRKKAQVTIFIILGLLILLFVALFFVFYVVDQNELDEQKQAPIHALIKQCIEDVASRNIRSLAAKGGYYEIPQYFVVYTLEDNPIQSYYPYYYQDHKFLVPEVNKLEEQFALSLLADMKECYNNTVYTLEETGEEDVSVLISEKEIQITYDSGMVFVQGDSRTTLDKITTTIPSTYYQAYLTATALANDQNTKDNTFCLSCLQDYEKENIIENIIIQEIALEPYYVILYAINYTEQARGDQILFMFAGRYEITPQETNVLLSAISDMNITVGYPFTYQVQAKGSGITFSDSSDLFTIDPSSGLISFMTEQEMQGTHLIEITATDSEGYTDTTLFYLTIAAVSEPPELNYIGYLQAISGQEFTYNVTQTKNQTIYYTDDSDLFVIELTSGKISFIPTNDQKGVHNITITAINDKGVSTTEMMYLIII